MSRSLRSSQFLIIFSFRICYSAGLYLKSCMLRSHYWPISLEEVTGQHKQNCDNISELRLGTDLF